MPANTGVGEVSKNAKVQSSFNTVHFVPWGQHCGKAPQTSGHHSEPRALASGFSNSATTSEVCPTGDSSCGQSTRSLLPIDSPYVSG